ncbi:hypothetical protein CAEBREN_16618 [Caenorhabditis brenneri]|uniref:Uncharacterized protein n=1 Tax=Caenorhabditis brenneri TaxID=135651 RepID=G0PJ81_CAEBE|nr:hypothetical protein CAEBREN_16618 [Caenorhabditis brenneri]
MSHCYLEQAGLYRATLEAMMFGSATPESEAKGFNDSVLERKAKKVTDLVKKFEKNMKLEDKTVETMMDKESEVAGMAAARSEATPQVQTKKVAQSTKSRSRIPSMEEFVDGILRASSPIPPAPSKNEAPAEPLVELQETPILTYRPVKRELNFALLDTALFTDITMSYRPTVRSEGRVRVAEAKASSTPKTMSAFTQESPDSAYNSPGSSASSIATTPLGSSTSAQTQDSAHSQDQEQELDVFLKLARAQLHATIKEYSAWDPEMLSTIAETGASRRHEALLKISEPCNITTTMLQIYKKCISGQTTKEMDTIIVSIVHLLEENVHLPRISILEEYLVVKFYKKTMQ